MSTATPRFDVVYFKLFNNCNAKCNMCHCWERPRSRKDISHVLCQDEGRGGVWFGAAGGLAGGRRAALVAVR